MTESVDMRLARIIIIVVATAVLSGCHDGVGSAKAAGSPTGEAAIANSIQAAVDRAASDRETARLAADRRRDDEGATRLRKLPR